MKKATGICAMCGNQHDLKGTTMVRHGWQMKTGHGYRYQVTNNCPGWGIPHFGTEKGRDFLAAEIIRTEEWLKTAVAKDLAQARAIESTKEWAEWQKKRLAEWKEKEPVMVEKVVAAPALHFGRKGYYYKNSKVAICCCSAMSEQRSAYSHNFTENEEAVTCKNCLKELERRKARANK